MTLIIFLKQSFRSLKKNFSIVILVFLFLIVGVSLIVGLSAYLFNAHQLTIDTAFKNGSQDGEVDEKNLAWDKNDSSTDRNVIFTNQQKEKFKKIVGKPEGLDLSGKEEQFYSFLINNNGYTQSFLYKPNDFRNGNEQKFKDWIETKFKWFNGSALAFYFKQIIKDEINSHWDLRTTNIIGNDDAYYTPDNGSLKAYLPDEKTVVLTTFDERWIDYDYQHEILPSETLFSPGDFTYHLRMSYEEYKKVENPLFLIEKNFRDFNLKVGDVVDVSNTLLPTSAKSEKFTVVGDFVNAGRLVTFSNKLNGAIPFSHFWETIQVQNNYLDLPFYITTNRNHANHFFQRAEEIQKQIERRKLFEARAGPNESLPQLIPGPSGQYQAVVLFWKINFPIVMLCILGIAILIFFVILFTTKQLIENNKATLQFLKSMGLHNFELSSINMTLILLPMVLGFLIAIPGFFIIQNLFSFILEIQYPMILNFWMWNYETIFIFLGTVVFAFVVFFFTNFSVLKRHNILEKKEAKLVKRIKSGKMRNYFYNRIQPKSKIGLAIWAANLRKNLVTFGTLLVTFAVILFGVGFKGSISHEAKLVQTTFLPFKNFSNTSAFLFTEQNLVQQELSYSQQTIGEEELTNPENHWEITAEMQEDELREILTSDLKNHYFTSQTIDEILDQFGGDFQQFLKSLEDMLKRIPEIPGSSIPEILKIVEQLYANYQIIKLQLEKVYKYSDNNLKFVFGRSVNPNINDSLKNVGRTLNLNVKINQKVNNRVPPKKIHSLGLIDQNLKKIFSLNSISNQIVEVKISQALATKLSIYKTELKFKKPTFNFDLALSNDGQSISIPVRVTEIIQADFTQDAIYYSFDNLKRYLQTINPPDEKLAEQLKKIKASDSQTEISNGYYIDGLVPNSLINLTIPIIKNNGNNIVNYIPDENSEDVEIQLLDFKIIGQNLITETASYINLVNRVIYVFIAITMIVALLLTYLFLVENKQNILLFKSLGYSVREIAKFLLVGYVIAAIVAAGFAIGISVLAISLLSNVFVELFNAIIPFAFTTFYSFLFVLLPILFIILIFISLWIYIFIQDPKRALDI